MEGKELADFAKALLIEFLEGHIKTFSLDHWPLTLKSFLQGHGVYKAGYCPDEDTIYFRPDIDDPDKAIENLYHEVGHRIYGEDETIARNYAERRFLEWRNMSDEAKRKKIIEGLEKVRSA